MFQVEVKKSLGFGVVAKGIVFSRDQDDLEDQLIRFNTGYFNDKIKIGNGSDFKIVNGLVKFD